MIRPRFFKTQALVLRSTPLGEADRLVTLLSPTLGKLTATARGVRKITSRIGGHLEPLTRCTVSLSRGRTLDTITGAATLEAFVPLREDLERLSRTLVVVELVDALTPLESPNPEGYDLLLETLRTLAGPEAPAILLPSAEVRLLGLTGFLPEMGHCVECRAPLIPGAHRLSLEAGGVLCGACQARFPACLPLSVDALKVLRFLSTATLEAASRLRLSPALGREVEALVHAMLRHVLEREVRSLAFLRALEHLAPQVPSTSRP